MHQLQVLVLEPYCGGSHASFVERLSLLPYEFTCMTFPARKWKWRMRLAAPYYAEKLWESEVQFDRILCSTFVDVAAFRGLAPAWVREVPLLTYFHENQFAYPVQVEDERDMHFGLTNMTTAMASDSLAFNSRYNFTSFLEGIEDLLKKSYDMELADTCDIIRGKSRILPPAMDFSLIDGEKESGTGNPPVILWNHRWEHDKNPEEFFRALMKLDGEGVEFGLIVLGQSFKDHPSVFDEAKKKLSHRIVHFGYVDSKRDYVRWLRQGDIVVSTARHEFFGISMVEAVRAGCRPLLPKRLSYPELFPEQYLYEENNFVGCLRDEILRMDRFSMDQARALTHGFSWESLAPAYASWLECEDDGSSK